MPSSRGRGWYCSAAARLQPPVDERPARTAPGFNRRCWSRRRGSRRGRTRRSPALRGRRGASFFYVDREHGHARRARWAARIPRTPALGTCSHAPLSTSPPTTLRTADRSGVRARSRERGALVQRHLAPLADPRRRVGLRARVCYTREDGGRSMAWHSDARPRRQLSPEGPARARSTRRPYCVLVAGPGRPRFWERGAGHRSQLHGGFRRQCDAQKFGIWDKKNCGHIWRASHLWAVGAPRGGGQL